MATIFHQVVIEASKNQVYDAITLKSGLSQWWMADCMVKPEVGCMNVFRMEGEVSKYRIALRAMPRNAVPRGGSAYFS